VTVIITNEGVYNRENSSEVKNLLNLFISGSTMKVILDIKDEKASFMIEVLKNFKDVKTTPISSYKADVLEGLNEAIHEVKLIKQGKLKGIPAKDLLDEL